MHALTHELLEMSARVAAKKMKKAGCQQKRQSGAHATYECPVGKQAVVPMHGGDIPIGTLKSIEKQSGVKLEGDDVEEAKNSWILGAIVDLVKSSGKKGVRFDATLYAKLKKKGEIDQQSLVNAVNTLSYQNKIVIDRNGPKRSSGKNIAVLTIGPSATGDV